MTPPPEQLADLAAKPKPPVHPFRRAVLRGLGVVLPPLLTIVIFLWVWNTIDQYVLVPVESASRYVIFHLTNDIQHNLPRTDTESIEIEDHFGNPVTTTVYKHEDRRYVFISNKQYVPLAIYDAVKADPGEPLPTTAKAYYERYINMRYLQRTVVLPVFLCVFILTLYLVGKFLAAGVGRLFYMGTERVIDRLPIVRNVYGSVKQVTDFIFSESELEFTRVVAVEYPRKGIWSLGFVTGESMLDIGSAANEPVVSVLIATSPMPATGFTCTVRKSETIDLNISLDQAIQFIVSCGVVVPAHQQYTTLNGQIVAAIAKQTVDGNGKVTSASLEEPTPATRESSLRTESDDARSQTSEG